MPRFGFTLSPLHPRPCLLRGKLEYSRTRYNRTGCLAQEASPLTAGPLGATALSQLSRVAPTIDERQRRQRRLAPRIARPEG